MRSCKLQIFFFLTLLLNTIQHQLFNTYDNRRLLHEPLFPVTSDPPPPQPPPPPPVISHSDQPFFPQVPITTSSPPSPPPPTEARENVTPRIPAAPQQAKRGGGQTQTITIAISVGIVTLGMLSALAFFVYRHCAKNNNETRKLVGSNSDGLNESSRVNSSRFLYIGTVEPSRVSQRDDEVKEAKGSPYHRLKKKIDKSDRYRPSPELQPLPPLGKVVPPPTWKSPLAGESGEDEESCDGGFYTPQFSSIKSDGKASSSKSRTFALSPDIKPVIIPAIKHPSPELQAVTSSPRQPVGKQPDSRLANLFPPTRPKSSMPPMRPNSVPPAPPPPPPPPPSRLSRPPVAPPPPLGLSRQPVAPPPPFGLSRPPKAPSSNVITHSHIERSVVNSTRLNSSSNGNIDSSEVIDNSNNSFDGGDEAGGVRPRLKPLHWDKVMATADRVTVWDQLDAGSFQLNEDRMESLFGCNSARSVMKDSNRRSVLPPVEKENRVLDPKKSQNIAILLRALNVTIDEVSEALLDGNPESIDAELLETLVKMAPTKEEEVKLCNYNGEVSKLGSAERFLKAILDIPFAFKRVEAMLYRVNFDAEIRYLKSSFETLEAASEELKNSRLFFKLLEAVLRTGNRMNVGTNRGDAKAFKLDTLLKLVDIKGTDGKTTLLHFVVEEIIRSEGANFDSINGNKMDSKIREEDIRKKELQVVAGLSRDLSNVKQAAGMDSDVLNSYLSKLERGLEIIREVLQFEKQDVQGRFINSMRLFLKEAEEEISRIKADEKRVLSLVKEVTEYFHGDAGKEEAHPFRIFVIVRDFLSILDKVCKDVGRFQNNTVVGSARSFRICPAASLPVLNRYNMRQDISSDEESSSS